MQIWNTFRIYDIFVPLFVELLLRNTFNYTKYDMNKKNNFIDIITL